MNEHLSERTKYVVGFVFDREAQRVVLIRKKRPDWQAGKLNGVGGHVEDYDETMEQAIAREFYEETGLSILRSEWQRYATITQPKGTCAVFRAFSGLIDGVETKTDEEIVIHSAMPWDIRWANAMPNLQYLIPLALDPTATADLYYYA